MSAPVSGYVGWYKGDGWTSSGWTNAANPGVNNITTFTATTINGNKTFGIFQLSNSSLLSFSLIEISEASASFKKIESISKCFY